jgi:hypothetical protein
MPAAISPAQQLKGEIVMIALALYVASLISPPPSSSQRCEELGRRLDGTYVTVCNGRVVRVRDAAGNSRTWDRESDTVTVRSSGRPPTVLGFDGR